MNTPIAAKIIPSATSCGIVFSWQ